MAYEWAEIPACQVCIDDHNTDGCLAPYTEYSNCHIVIGPVDSCDCGVCETHEYYAKKAPPPAPHATPTAAL